MRSNVYKMPHADRVANGVTKNNELIRVIDKHLAVIEAMIDVDSKDAKRRLVVLRSVMRGCV